MCRLTREQRVLFTQDDHLLGECAVHLHQGSIGLGKAAACALERHQTMCEKLLAEHHQPASLRVEPSIEAQFEQCVTIERHEIQESPVLGECLSSAIVPVQ